ncbi:hypothetical protein V7S43_007488 [Phytophthora oleae]|uniref:Kazal-like domain-containing protein n=1 Tax=Phytophthora oleae TaxID=2107226 RepID=A0ABD3FNQ9_9STRA
MKFTASLLLGVVAASTTYALSPPEETTVCPFMCSDQFLPVCGSDGVTYSNECLMNLADCESSESITKVHDGECGITTEPSTNGSGSAGCPDVCPTIYKPVCGSDGVTYSSDCVLDYVTCTSGGAITQVSEGECPGYSSNSGTSEAGSAGSSGCSEVCIEIWRPVCGSDGVTYSNSCFLGIASCKDPYITQAHEGACETTEGSEETTGGYEFNNTSTESSQETTSCPSVCLAIYSPVCGSDGVTYGNECKLDVESCNHPELHLTKAYDGACLPVECKTG